MRVLWVAAVTCVFACALGHADPDTQSPHDKNLPHYKGAHVAAKSLVAAHQASDDTTFEQFLNAPSPSLIRVVATLLFPAGRAPTDTERDVAQRIADQAPSVKGVAPFVAYWLQADVATLQAERSRWGLSARFTLRLAQRKVEEALAVITPELPALRKARHSHQADDLLRDYARLLVRLGRAAEAETELRGLLERVRAEHRTHEELGVLVTLSRAVSKQGRYKESAALFRSAQALAERLGDWATAAGAGLELGWRATRQGDYDAADRSLRQALAIATASGHGPGTTQVHMALAHLAFARGRAVEGEIYATRAFEANKGAERPHHAARAAALLATMHKRYGRLAKAHTFGRWLERHADRLTRPTALGDAHQALAELARARHAPKEAYHHLQAGLAAYGRHPDGARAQAAILCAMLGAGVAPKDERPALIDRYLALVEQQATWGARAPWILAGASALMRSFGDTVSATSFADRALEVARSSPDMAARHRGIAAKADDLRAQGAFAQAEPLYREALRVAIAGSQQAAHYALGRARCLVALERPREAIEAIQEALTWRVNARVDVRMPDALALRVTEHEIAAFGIEAAHAWRKKDPASAEAAAERAWAFREWGHARLLAEAVAASRVDRQAGSEQIAVALAALEDSQRQLVVALARDDSAHVPALRATFDERVVALRRLQRQASGPQSAPERAGILSLGDVRGALTPDDAVLAFSIAGGQLFGMVVREDGVQWQALGSADHARALARGWRKLAASQAPDGKVAARLYDQWIRPFDSNLRPASRWTVLPASPLAGVPFEALMRSDANGSSRVIEHHAIRYAPSLAVLRALGNRAQARGAPRGVVAVGAPSIAKPELLQEHHPVLARIRGGLALGDLPGSATEVRGVASLYEKDAPVTLTGDTASVDRFLESVDGRSSPLRAVHFACHGIVDDRYPDLSGLVLAGGEVLTAERIRTLRVDADLVVLSACDSGAGASAVGEGTLGLSRAFLLAGASQVLCSTWQIADDATTRLMTSFHRRVRDGQDALGALREARLAMLRDPPTAHPFYWAGFQLWGAASKR